MTDRYEGNHGFFALSEKIILKTLWQSVYKYSRIISIPSFHAKLFWGSGLKITVCYHCGGELLLNIFSQFGWKYSEIYLLHSDDWQLF